MASSPAQSVERPRPAPDYVTTSVERPRRAPDHDVDRKAPTTTADEDNYTEVVSKRTRRRLRDGKRASQAQEKKSASPMTEDGIPEPLMEYGRRLVEEFRERQKMEEVRDGRGKNNSAATPSVELPRRAPDHDVSTRRPPAEAGERRESGAGAPSVELPRRAPDHDDAPSRPRTTAEEKKTPSVELPWRAPDHSAPPRNPRKPNVPASAEELDRISDHQDEDQEEDRSGSLTEWKLSAVGETFSNRFQAIRWMEVEQRLDFRVNVSPSGDFLIRARSREQNRALEIFADQQPQGVVLERTVKEVRGVVLSYPVHLPLDPIVEHPAVVAAERCLYSAGRGRRLPTRSVQVTLRGQLPSSLDLGCWGRYACRRFVPEPIRCFRCQAFGHHQRHCRRLADLCGRCSGEHSTRECLLRLREGEGAPSPLCPNCGAAHQAWHRRCPERLRRIQGAKQTTKDTVTRPSRPPPDTAGPSGSAGPERSEGGRRRRQRRNRRRRGRATGGRSLPPPAAPRKDEEALSRRTGNLEHTAATTGEQTHRTVTPSLPPAEKRREKTAVGAGARAKDPRAKTTAVTDQRRRSQSSQTQGCFVHSEGALADLLVQYEHLLAQEFEAQARRIPHEPALHCARRHIRERRKIPIALPMEKPLKCRPRFRHHIGEEEWVDFSGGDNKDDVEEETMPQEEEEEEEIDPLEDLASPCNRVVSCE